MCNEILIVDDDPDLRETMKDLLTFEGFRATTASNGIEALQQVTQQEQPCLVLLDLMMPVMDGWQFLETMERQHSQILNRLQIIVVSAVADLSGLQNRYRCQVMKKPADVQSLVAIARQYC